MHHYILLSVLQLLAESLPVSSSGHLVLLKDLLVQFNPEGYYFYLSNSMEAWIHLLHVPTALCLAWFFRGTWWPLVRYVPRWYRLVIKLVWFTLAADFVTALFFLVSKRSDWFAMPLYIGFFITMCCLFSLIWCHKKDGQFNVRSAVIIGTVQGVALLPGVSRCATTFVAARWLGFAPRHAFAIAWMVQVPLVLGASLKSLIFFKANMAALPVIDFWFVIVLMVATLGAYALLVFAYRMALARRWWLFGWYMLVPLICSLIL